MLVKAARKEGTNMSVAAGTAYSIAAHTVSSNRTFILTDLIFSTNDTGEGITIYDSASEATPTAGQTKMKFQGNPQTITDMANGPEFSVAVGGALIGNRALPTYSLFVGGFER